MSPSLISQVSKKQNRMVSSAQKEMIFLGEEEDKTGVNSGHLVILFSLRIRIQGPLLQEGFVLL